MGALLVLTGLSFGLAVASVVMLVRNNWVYRERVRLLWSDPAAYERLPSYNRMILRFWVWDVAKFCAGDQ
jgi:hypothetical protein